VLSLKDEIARIVRTSKRSMDVSEVRLRLEQEKGTEYLNNVHIEDIVALLKEMVNSGDMMQVNETTYRATPIEDIIDDVIEDASKAE